MTGHLKNILHQDIQVCQLLQIASIELGITAEKAYALAFRGIDKD
jgi:hypothetical protein